jgi:hypothetical protein
MRSVQCFADLFDKSRWRIFLFSIGKRLLQLSRKSRQRTTRYYVFCSVGHLIQSAYMESCYAAQKRLLLRKGQGYYKICLKRYCDEKFKG